MKEVLSEYGVKYAFVDITSGMGALKQFLKLRDTMDAFADARAGHYVGIPVLLVDGVPHLLDGAEQTGRLVEALGLAGEAGASSAGKDAPAD